MHRIAEQGIAAHWKYKERPKNVAGHAIDHKDAQRFHWLRQLMEWQQELKDPQEFLESVKVDLFQDEVYVFTPRGEIKVFPRTATPVDFAFAVHSNVGNKCTGARVNGQIVPLRYQLRNGRRGGDPHHPNRNPNKDWLEFAVTSRARSKIRSSCATSSASRRWCWAATSSSGRCTPRG
jgi:guanosine-3',5'-bis(diphosphate) 3'-pyrophosphohydrolase